MTAATMTMALAIWLVALGLGAAALHRHRVALIVGGQLGSLGATLAILTMLGADGVMFAVIVAVLTTLMALLVTVLLNVGGTDATAEAEGDPLRW